MLQEKTNYMYTLFFASNSEMEDFLHTTIDTLPGVISCSCNIILSRIKDIKGLRL